MAKEISIVKESSIIRIGRQNENGVREIQFDITDWFNLYGDGTVQLLHKRSADEVVYPIDITVEGMTVKWLVNDADTAYSGSGRAEMRYYIGSMLKVSKTWETIVEKTLAGGTPAEPPEPQKGWVDSVLQAGTDAEDSAKRAQNSEDLANQYAQDAISSAEEATSSAKEAERAAELAKKYAEESQGTLDHDKLSNRDFADAHPIDAITGLRKILNDLAKGGGGGGTLEIGDNLYYREDGKLDVLTTDKMEKDNTRPITSAAVEVQVGNINSLLETI